MAAKTRHERAGVEEHLPSQRGGRGEGKGGLGPCGVSRHGNVTRNTSKIKKNSNDRKNITPKINN